jgi:hypothetical protein
MKTSVAQALSALQQREQAVKQAEAEALRQLDDQTHELLQQHRNGLTKLSRDARQQIGNDLDRLQVELRGECRRTAALMRRLLLWPLIATGALCLCLTAGSSLAAYLIVSRAQARAAMDSQTQTQALRRQLAQIEAEWCLTSPAARRACQNHPKPPER